MGSVTSYDYMIEETTQSRAAAVWAEVADELLRFATVLVGPHDAHDVVADTFVRCRPRLDEGQVENPRSYLMRAVSNRATDMHRSTRRRRARDIAAVVPTASAAVGVDVDVQRAVAALSVTQRAVVYLAYWEDRSERDIADLLEMSAGSVHRHLARARTTLRKTL